MGQEQWTSPFIQVWNNIESEAHHHISQFTKETLGINPHEYRGNNAGAVHRAIRNAVNGIRAQLAGGYIKSPERYGASLLQKTIGKEIASETIRIAGINARTSEINLIHQNRDAVIQAHNLNPNAVVLLFNHHIREDHGKWEPRGNSEPGQIDLSSTRRIIEQARQLFDEESTRMIRIYEQSGTRQITLDQLWESFSGMNPTAIRRFPDGRILLPGLYPRIAALEIRAGVSLTFSAIHALHRRISGDPGAPTNLLTAYIRASSNRSITRKGPTQRELRDQLFRICHAHSRNINICCPQHEDYLEKLNEIVREQEITQEQEIPGWDAWTQDLPAEICLRKPRKPGKLNRPTGQNNTRDTVSEIMNDGLAGQLVRTASTAITLEHSPGQRLALIARDRPEPILEMERDPTGFIRETHSEEWTMPSCLPAPHGDQPEVPGWTTQSTWSRTITREAITQIAQDPLWKARFHRRKPRELQVQSILKKHLQRAGAPDLDREISRELLKAIRGMIHPGVWEQARNLGPDPDLGDYSPSLREYNIEASDQTAFQQVHQSNPGATAWVRSYCHLTERINHPGQIITLAREDMLEHGLEPRYWKTAATQPLPQLRNTPNLDQPEATTTLMNIAGANGKMPGESTITQLFNTIRNEEHLQQEPGRGNIIRALTLACQELGRLTQQRERANPSRRSPGNSRTSWTTSTTSTPRKTPRKTPSGPGAGTASSRPPTAGTANSASRTAWNSGTA